jgi:hypothetical protein
MDYEDYEISNTAFRMYSVFHLILHMNLFTHKTKPIAILNSYSRILLLQLMLCLKSVRPQFQLFCHLMSTCHRQTLPVTRNFVTSRCIAALFVSSLSGCALLNASRRAENDFDAIQCTTMNIRSACEYHMFAHAQLLRNWREQRPSN